MTWSNFEKQKFGKQQRLRSGVFIKCETCAREFYASPARVRQSDKLGSTIRFCSLACVDKTGAKNPSFGRNHSEESKRKMSENPNRPKFRSDSSNPNVVRYGVDFVHKTPKKKLRDRVREERGNKCERCGYSEYAGVLEVHHRDRDSTNNRMENLALLCPTCHSVYHFLRQDGAYSKLKKAS